MEIFTGKRKRKLLDANRRLLEVFNLNFINQVQVIVRHIVFGWHLIRWEFSRLEISSKSFRLHCKRRVCEWMEFVFEKWPYFKLSLCLIVYSGLRWIGRKVFQHLLKFWYCVSNRLWAVRLLYLSSLSMIVSLWRWEKQWRFSRFEMKTAYVTLSLLRWIQCKIIC